MLELDLNQDEQPFGTMIKVFGIGGAGGNAINTMIEGGLEGVEFIAANTNLRDLKRSRAKAKLQLGQEVTRGLGAGASPDVGRKSAEESKEEIKENIEGADLLFIVAGMGKGTGTGAAPVVAQLAQELGILTVALVCTPFVREGKKRNDNAQSGIVELRKYVDTLMVVPNEKLRDSSAKATIFSVFKRADNTLFQAAKAVTDVIHHGGYMNVDFADVRTIMMSNAHGFAMMGSGEAEGEDRAAKAIDLAIRNPLLSDISLSEAKGVLINITSGDDLMLEEFDEITGTIADCAGNNGEVITGLVQDDDMQGKVKVTVIATGLMAPPSYDDEMITMQQMHATASDDGDDEEDIGDVLKNIRMHGNNTSLLKQTPSEDDEKYKTGQQMEIPAFLRKFSN
jgi:cell division protein FtsZ